MIAYTEMEQQVMDSLLDIQNDGIFIIYPGDITNYTGINIKILRGILSSLIKKDAIDVDESLISVFDDNYRVEE